MGGTGALVDGLVRLFEDLGGRLVLDARAEEIEVDGGRVRAVRLASGERFEAGVVVSNGDVANTYRKLIKPEHRRKWTDRRLERMKYAMSLFVAYFGTDRTYPHLPHHSIVLGPPLSRAARRHLRPEGRGRGLLGLPPRPDPDRPEPRPARLRDASTS